MLAYKLSSLLLIVSLTSSFVFSQVDYNDYQPLRSFGEIPDDFLVRSYSKIEADRLEGRTNLKKKQEKIFLEGIHYSIDELLHSGEVTFGDPITKYINVVADKLLSSNQTLRSKLRFYTLKSNTVNAFSTDQGIVFVTIGLITRLTNEEQLAFVLAHEISHYTEKHVINSFDFEQNEGENDNYKLSAYSQDNEFEADALGLQMYLNAGYSISAIDAVFDVLMFSHLPFEEKKIDPTYFSDKSFTIPGDRFTNENFPIKTDEDYNDELSSHPNIRKRRENIDNTLKKLDANFSVESSSENNSVFLELVKMARYESVRIDVLYGNYINAVNTIYLLEDNQKPTIYLERMKAAAWFGISSQKQNGSLNNFLPSKKNYEGSISLLYDFLSKENTDAINSLSISKLYSSKAIYPSDEFISSIWELKMASLAAHKQFDLKKYDSLTLNEALSGINDLSGKEFEKAKNNILANYYVYGLANIILTGEFKKDIDRHKKQLKEQLKSEKDILLLSKKELKRLEATLLNYGLTDVIMLEPHVISYSKKGIKLVKSEKLSESFSESITYCEKSLGMNVTLISSKSLSANSIEEFNENAILDNYLTQLISGDGNLPISVDKDGLKQLQAKYKTSKLLLTNIVHTYKPNLNIVHYGITFAWPPMGFILIPIGLMSGNNTTVNYILLDLEEEKVMAYGKKEYHDPVTPKTMKAFVFDIMSQLHTTKL
jgi:Zn-dependent protease with chaperone function